MRHTTPCILGDSIRILSVVTSLLGLHNSAQGAVVFVPLPETNEWLHVIESDEQTFSSRLDFDGDGIGDVMIASDFSGVSLFTGRNVRMLVVGGVTANAPEGTILDSSPLIQGVGTWLYGNDVEKLTPPEWNLLPLKRQIALAGLGLPPFTRFGQGGGYIAIETTGPDGVHYGWLHIENDNPEWLTGGRVTGYAYETTPGVPIVVGAVPESSTTLWLSFAGLGTALRRRR